MFVGIDDTDSREGMCTTYIAARLFHRFKESAVGLPWLVRLNPNIRYKTRGNGAVVVEIGRPGEVDSAVLEEQPDEEYYEAFQGVIEFALDLVSRYSVTSDNTNPGVVFSRRKLPGKLYRDALYREISIDEVKELLKTEGARYHTGGNGRGIIGASAAIAWPGSRHTYEAINYFYPHGRQRGLDEKMSIAGEVNMARGTFDSIDNRNRRAAIFPKERTPVVYGIRGIDPESIQKIAEYINTKYSIESEMITVFKSNQGTDDHIVSDPVVLDELGSYSVRCRVAEVPHSGNGGHYFFKAMHKGEPINFAAFEPTKEFRSLVRLLVPGDLVVGFGSYLDKTINLERLSLESAAVVYRRNAPQCSKCRKPMSNHGSGDFRCRSCGTADHIPSYSKIERDLLEGDYEVPVSARRHLSMPLVLKEGGRLRI